MSGLAPGSVQVKGLLTNEHDKGSYLLEVPDWNENHHGAGKGAEQDLYSFSDVALVRLGIRLLGYDDKHKLGAILASGVEKREKHSSKLFSPIQQTNQCTHIIITIIIIIRSICTQRSSLPAISLPVGRCRVALPPLLNSILAVETKITIKEMKI